MLFHDELEVMNIRNTIVMLTTNMFKLSSYKVKDWRVWFITLIGFATSLLLFFIVIQPTRLWFFEPQKNPAYSIMFDKHKDNVLVYVVDSGVESSVNEWLTNNTIPGYDAINDIPGGNKDCTGHGTQVASVIGNNVDSVNVKVVPVKTAGCSSVSNPVAIVRGLNWIIDNHPQNGSIGIINMSFGYIDSIPFLDGIQNAVQSALDAGFVVVASAGNNSIVDDSLGSIIQDACNEVPANVDGVITVGAAEMSFSEGTVQRAPFSNSGSCITLFAEGSNIMTSTKNVLGENITEYANGTSFAAPYVSAALAKKLLLLPDSSREEIKKSILEDAVAGAITSNSESPLEPNINVVVEKSTPNLFLEYNFADYEKYMQSYKSYDSELSPFLTPY